MHHVQSITPELHSHHITIIIIMTKINTHNNIIVNMPYRINMISY